MTRTSTRVCTWSRADALDLSRLHEPEQQTLHTRGCLADLVHEHRAAIRQLEDT